jgi:DNA-directed RNA polymerase specialized sigma24 family protein
MSMSKHRGVVDESVTRGVADQLHDAIVSTLRPMQHRVIAARLRSSDIDDVLQEAQVGLSSALSKSNCLNPTALSIVIAARKACSAIRCRSAARRRLARLTDQLHHEPPRQDDKSESADDSEAEFFASWLQQQPDGEFWARIFHQLLAKRTWAQIASALGTTQGAMKMRWLRMTRRARAARLAWHEHTADAA